MAEAFRRGEDIHSRTAQEVFDVAPFAQTREHRRVAKVINFGVIYGLSAFGLAQQLDIDTKEAAKFIAAYFERYSGVKEYLDRQICRNAQDSATRRRSSAASGKFRRSIRLSPTCAISPSGRR